MQRVIVVTGCQGSGKSSLIKALFPSLEVDFSEVESFRLYELHESLSVAEVSGKPDALSALLLSELPWRLEAGIALVDGARMLRVDGRALALAAKAPRKSLVLTKADAAPRQLSGEVRRLASRFGFEFFEVSATRGLGVRELRAWLLELRPHKAPAGALMIDVVPVPTPGAVGAGGLSEEERRILELCDGRRSVGEIAAELGSTYGAVRRVIDLLYARGYIRDLGLRSSV